MKGTVHPRKGYEGPEREKVNRSTIILTSVLDMAGLDEGKKIFPPPGFDPQIFQPIASQYTNYAIVAHL